MLRWQGVDIGVLQNVKTFGIGLHQAVFDAVMNHFDEMPGADRAGVDITLLDAGVASLAPAGARDIAGTRRQACEDRIETIDHRLVAADHHAIAAVDSPNPAAGADVDIVDSAFLQRLAAAYVVLPERIAAIDDDVAGLHQLRQRIDRRLGDLARRQHHPGGPRPLELIDEILQRAGADRTIGRERRDRLRILVVNDGGVSVLHQPADDIAAHPAQADHAELHWCPLIQRIVDRGIELLQSRFEIALEMHA